MKATTINQDQLHTVIMTSMFTVVLNDPQVCILITVWVCQSALGQLVKMLMSFEPHGYLDQILHSFYYYYCSSIGMQNSDEALSIILAGQGISLKMLITLEQHYIF